MMTVTAQYRPNIPLQARKAIANGCEPWLVAPCGGKYYPIVSAMSELWGSSLFHADKHILQGAYDYLDDVLYQEGVDYIFISPQDLEQEKYPDGEMTKANLVIQTMPEISQAVRNVLANHCEIEMTCGDGEMLFSITQAIHTIHGTMTNDTQVDSLQAIDNLNKLLNEGATYILFNKDDLGRKGYYPEHDLAVAENEYPF